MIKLVTLALFAISANANFLVKYKSGKIAKSKVDPRKTLAIVAMGGDEVEYVEADPWLKAHSTNDQYRNSQWAMSYYLNNSFDRMNTHIQGGQVVNVAVIDTGITNHPDLNSIVINGADFIADSNVSRDGDGRDTNPNDPGDYSDPSISCSGSGSSSSWHGTHVGGIIGAVRNNYVGVAGSTGNVRIQPLRVLGPCGGLSSDIADAIRWAVGGSVSGLPINPNPSKVINMSLGGQGSCSRYMQEAIDFANSRGAVIVVSSGNSGANVDAMNYTPVSCRGVLRVGAIHSSMGMAHYSNFGNIVDIYAPGSSIFSTFNMGYTTASSSTYKSADGTSMAAGFVSATAAAIFSKYPTLFADQVKDAIASTAESIYCNGNTCINGTIDPYEAVIYAGSLSADPNYRYPDPVVVGGYSAQSSQVFITNDDGGGACGTIDYVDGGGGPKGPMTMILLFIICNLFLNKNLKNRIKQRP